MTIRHTLNINANAFPGDLTIVAEEVAEAVNKYTQTASWALNDNLEINVNIDVDADAPIDDFYDEDDEDDEDDDGGVETEMPLINE